MTDTDRFGNRYAEGLPYARGNILTSTQDDHTKLARARDFIQQRHATGQPVYNLTGLERSLPIDASAGVLDDEMAPALCGHRLDELALEHLGGLAPRDDVLVSNRLTAAIYVAMQVLVPQGGTVVGVSAGYSHSAVVRAVRDAGGQLFDTRGLEAFTEQMAALDKVDVVVLTRLAVTYEALPNDDLPRIVALARDRGARIFVDDAGGCRVGPAIFGQPRTLELDVDAGATGLDKYGTVGPRLGLLAGRRELVAAMRVRAFELGMEARPMLYPAVVRSLEQYTPERVRDLVRSTKVVGDKLREQLGDRVHETPVIIQLHGEDVLEEVMERSGRDDPPIVPYEATAALAMLLLRDHGILTVHFAGLPPGSSALMVKFLPSETIERLGGPDVFAKAVGESLDRLAELCQDPGEISRLLFGGSHTA